MDCYNVTDEQKAQFYNIHKVYLNKLFFPLNMIKFLTPDVHVYGEMGGSKSISCLAGVPAGILLIGVYNLQLGRDSLQLPDFGRARLAWHRQIIFPIFQPLYTVLKRTNLLFEVFIVRPKKVRFFSLETVNTFMEMRQ